MPKPSEAPGDVEHDSIGRAEREVGDVDATCDADHELGAARRRHDAEGRNCPLSGEGCDRLGDGAEREGCSDDDGQHWLHQILTLSESVQTSES